MGRRLVAPLWLAGLVAAMLGLAGTGQGPLAPPPVAPGEWGAWASERTPIEAAAAVVRLGALMAAGYLLAVTVLGLGAALLRRRPAVVAVARWSPSVVRRLLGAWLAGALAVGPAAASGASPPPTMVLLPDDEPATPPSTVPPAPAPPVPAPAPADATITLGPGDHLWSVAARTLATAWGRPAAEREVAPYWRLLVEVNRASLPNPADPDLVFPGDVVRLPPVPR
jgi:nucleoid-associated protein YgaU